MFEFEVGDRVRPSLDHRDYFEVHMNHPVLENFVGTVIKIEPEIYTPNVLVTVELDKEYANRYSTLPRKVFEAFSKRWELINKTPKFVEDDKYKELFE